MTGGDRGTVRVFIGFDPREAVAFDVLAFSIQARASSPVSIAPLKLEELGDLMWRERHELHRFQWLEGGDLIGKLPSRWNHLVDYDPPLAPEELSNLHLRIGTSFRTCSR